MQCEGDAAQRQNKAWTSPQAANRWQQHLIFLNSCFIGHGEALPVPCSNKSRTESVSANFVRFYCSLIISMKALIG